MIRAPFFVRIPGSLLMFLLAGCVVGPDYRRPDLPVPAAWQAEKSSGVKKTALEPERLARWWQALNDPHLAN